MGGSERSGSVARSASRVSLATLCSRVLGLFREAVFAALFSVTWVSDAFVFAFRIPNLLRDFFAEGALASAFVPAYTEVREREGPERAFLLARRTLGTLGFVTLLLAGLGVLFAPALVNVIAWDAPADVQPLIARLTRIMFPFLPLVALAAVLMGVLNAAGRYFIPALAPALFNVAAVAGGVVLLFVDTDVETKVVAWSALVVLGGLLQVLVQVPAARRVGLRGAPMLDLRFADPALRLIVRRMGPVLLSVAATNIMLLITTALASRGEGWASSLSYAFRLVHLPIGMIGVALGTVLLAAGSRAFVTEDAESLDRLGRRTLRLNAFLALPAAVGLYVLADPLVAMLYQRGQFDAGDTAAVAIVLRAYAPGIVFYAGIKAAAPLFLARGDTRTPMLCSLLGIAAHLAVALLAVPHVGVRALAWAVAVGAAVNFLLLRWHAWSRTGKVSFPGMRFWARLSLATALMGLLAWTAQQTGWVQAGASAHPGGALRLLVTVALAGVAYFGVAAWLGLDEARDVAAWLRTKARRGT